MKQLFLCLSFIIISFAMRAQKMDTIPSRVNLGLNLATLVSGTPELQGEYYFNKYVGAFAATGYTFRPVRGWIKVKDDVNLESQHGAYWKIGFKARLFRPDKRIPLPWIQLLYIGSQYDERGTQDSYNYTTGAYSVINRHESGIVHGGAVAVGADFRAGRHFIIRVGFQSGYYKRNDHMGSSLLTYQPGFGAEGFLLPEQAMLCVMYRLGNVDRK
ncbi:MAG: hypothetical protein KDC07_03000 [Chitinophagaceae bacterium]|nr:hypothetical protein [Chitinophagaceae bacterium]MCB9044831.1 hypothetical protein [Chitinophagales bacterium]